MDQTLPMRELDFGHCPYQWACAGDYIFLKVPCVHKDNQLPQLNQWYAREALTQKDTLKADSMHLDVEERSVPGYTTPSMNVTLSLWWD